MLVVSVRWRLCVSGSAVCARERVFEAAAEPAIAACGSGSVVVVMLLLRLGVAAPSPADRRRIVAAFCGMRSWLRGSQSPLSGPIGPPIDARLMRDRPSAPAGRRARAGSAAPEQREQIVKHVGVPAPMRAGEFRRGRTVFGTLAPTRG